jgi:hypothetical protein
VTRRQLEERVAQLAAELDGAALVDAVRRFADGLSTEEREVLGEVLLERGREQGAEQYAEMTERMRAARWRVILPPTRERPGPQG